MRYFLPLFSLVACLSTATAQTTAAEIPTDTTSTIALLVGEWQFVHVLGPDGKPTDHINKYPGPDGEQVRVNANGPDITIRADRTYQKRFDPQHADVGIWSLASPSEVVYTMVIPMDSGQGEMIRFAEGAFNKKWETDGKGNYLDASSDHIVRLTANEMRVLEDGYTFVYTKP